MGSFPSIGWVRQDLTGPVVSDPATRTGEALGELALTGLTRPGQSVAVAVGSRGIANLAAIVAATVAHLRDDLGLEPFIVPAMGSHGGADAHAQRAILAGFGITEDGVGAPVHSSMDVTEVARIDDVPVVMDALAAAADHVLLINRIKPHTLFAGRFESGLTKMLLIGLGKHEGARTFHAAAQRRKFDDLVTEAVPAVAAARSILAGVAIVENGRGETARIEAVPGADILDREPALLDDARRLLPRVPFDDVDVVLVDRIGKDVSGTGWDPNALGRKGDGPTVRTIVVRALTEGTAGNATGVGLAELCRTRVVEAMDREVTFTNVTTSGNVAAGAIPVHLDTDRELLEVAATRAGRAVQDLRLVWLRDTSHLEVVACSEELLAVARTRADLDVLGAPFPLPFDDDGNLPDLLPEPPTGS